MQRCSLASFLWSRKCFRKTQAVSTGSTLHYRRMLLLRFYWTFQHFLIGPCHLGRPFCDWLYPSSMVAILVWSLLLGLPGSSVSLAGELGGGAFLGFVNFLSHKRFLPRSDTLLIRIQVLQTYKQQKGYLVQLVQMKSSFENDIQT